MESRGKHIANVLRYLVLRLEYLYWKCSRKERGLPESFDKILVVEHNYLGDVIAVTPALRALKQRYPESEITVWTLESSQDILKGNPNISDIITEYDSKDYDLMVVFHAGRRWDATEVYMETKEIPYRVGVTRAGVMSSHFPRLDRKVKYGNKYKHIVEDNLDVVRLLGAEIDDKSYELYTNKGFEKPRGKLVVFHPGSKNIMELENPSHMWPVERWARLGDYIYLNYRANIYITGTKEERPLAEKIINEMHYPATNKCGELDIPELIAVIKETDLMVSMDTGPAHIAAAFDIPLVDLMGPQDPEIWRPWQTNNSVVMFHDEACTKCKRLECSRNQDCMRAITVEEVKHAVQQII